MDFIGLDIGSITTKAVWLRQTGKDKYRLQGATMFGTPPGGMNIDSEQGYLVMAENLKKGLKEANLHVKNVVASLPESEVYTRIVTMPQMPRSELESAINWEAEQNIPLPISEVNFSYTLVDKKADNSMEVMIVAAPKKLVEKYQQILNMADLNPVGIETQLIAASRALFLQETLGPTMLMIMGARMCEIAIVKGMNLVFTRSIATAGEALSRSLTTSLQLEVNQAESYKRTYGLLEDQLEGKVAAALRPVLDVIIREAKRTVNFYETKESGLKIKTTVLAGGTAGLPGLVQLMASGLNIEVQVGNSLSKISGQDKRGEIPSELLPQYTVALGLGMKEV